MLSCKETTQLISESLERQLSLRERLAIRLHLLVCRFCPRYRRQILLIDAAMKRLKVSEEAGDLLDSDAPALSAEARKRIEDFLRKASRQ